jgi:hypothetical protein
VAIAGVFGACALGVGLGLWARPPAEPKPAAEAGPPQPALRIVMTDGPAPVGQPLEVLPADIAAAHAPRASGLPRLIPVEPQAPRPAAGLVKVDAVVAPAPALVLPAAPPAPSATPPVAKRPKSSRASEAATPKVKVAREEARPDRPAKLAPKPLAKLATAVKAAPKTVAAKAKAAVTPKPKTVKAADASPVKAQAEKARTAKLEKAKLEKAKLEKAKLEKARVEKARVEKAKLEKIRVEKVRVEKARAEKARLEKKVRLEKARAEKAQAEKAKLVKAKAAKKAAPPPVRVAKAKPVPPPARKVIVPRGEGPMRVARNGCGQADPGEALVCADSRLAARDRQLQQAYRNAEAAGVPASALRRQQARWVQARAAAARDAPWAVEDVYEARISELNELSRDAREY